MVPRWGDIRCEVADFIRAICLRYHWILSLNCLYHKVVITQLSRAILHHPICYSNSLSSPECSVFQGPAKDTTKVPSIINLATLHKSPARNISPI